MKLELFVHAESTMGRLTVKNLRMYMETHWSGQYELEVFDVFSNIDIVQERKVSITPCLFVHRNGTTRKLVGDLRDSELLNTYVG